MLLAGEAAALEMLEGRNPLAMAHYANHPAQGQVPNAVIASFTFRPAGCSGSSGSSDGSSSNDSSSDGISGVEPWMRAYVPNINYSFKCRHEDLLTRVSLSLGCQLMGSVFFWFCQHASVNWVGSTMLTQGGTPADHATAIDIMAAFDSPRVWGWEMGSIYWRGGEYR
jgi:hypothetical protein